MSIAKSSDIEKITNLKSLNFSFRSIKVCNKVSAAPPIEAGNGKVPFVIIAIFFNLKFSFLIYINVQKYLK